MFDSTAAVLQVMPGNRLRVFIALVSLQHLLPVGERDVAAVAGVHRHTVRSHLLALAALGLVARGPWQARNSWTLTAVAYQLPLPGLGLFSGEESKTCTLESKLTTLSLSSSSRSNIKTKKGKNSGEEEERAGESKTWTLVDAELAAALAEAGVGRNAWRKLSECGWVSSEYVRAHTWLRKKNGDPLRYQVQRMLDGDGMPVVVETAVCERCGRKISPLIGWCSCNSIHS